MQAEDLFPGILEQQFGINSDDDVTTIRERLTSIEHTGVPEDRFNEWENESLTGQQRPQPVTARFDRLMKS